MRETKHTPGTWSVIHNSENSCVVANGKIIADGLSRADATLMAAAPTLLEALQALSVWGRTQTSPLDPNSPHALLVNAHYAIADAIGD